MQAGLSRGPSPARRERAKHRHELRTLTYVTLDQANGGIIRNLNHQGIAVQAVAAVRPLQQLRVRFELRNPRLRVEARGEVTWSTMSGQCGIRFLDMSPRMTRQINEWIFGNLLEGISPHAENAMFTGPMLAHADLRAAEQDDGLMVSEAAAKVIELPVQPGSFATGARVAELDWLSQPLSGRSLIWTIDTLVVVAALFLFALVFLSITGEPPRWPFTMAAGAALFVAGFYWGFVMMFGGSSLGKRFARLVGSDAEEEDSNQRFR